MTAPTLQERLRRDVQEWDRYVAMPDGERRSKRYACMAECGNEMRNACNAAAAEIERLTKDAERYRWLKESLTCDGDDYGGFLGLRGKFQRECPDDLDAAIDAAMAGKGGA